MKGTAIVTGGSGGNGRAILWRLLEDGIRVIVADTDPAGEAFASECRGMFGNEAAIFCSTGTLHQRTDLISGWRNAGRDQLKEGLAMAEAIALRTEAASRELAEVFGMERLWRIPDRPVTHVTFNGWAARKGIPSRRSPPRCVDEAAWCRPMSVN